jgi:WD40 repeat protein
MITIPSDGVATRQRIRLTELNGTLNGTLPPEEVNAALAACTASRLIVVSSDTAEIAHDIVLHTWPRLQSWLESDRAQIALVTQLTDAAHAWEESARDPAFLYRSSRLAGVRDDLDEAALPSTVREFLASSIERERQETRASQRRRQVRTALIACLAVMAILSSCIAYVAFRQREAADRQRLLVLLALSGRVTFASRMVNDQTLSSLLAVAAWRIAPTDEARTSMVTALAQEGTVIPAAAISGQTGRVNEVAISPDGRFLATASADGTARLWDLSDPTHPQGTAATLTGHTEAVDDVAFSPDGRTLASASADKTVRLWNSATGKPIGRPLTGHTHSVWSVTFSPDGRILATTSEDGTARLWDATTGRRIVAPLAGHVGAVYGLAFSPDGRTLATAGDDNTVRLWDAAAGRPIVQPLVGSTGGITKVTFTAFRGKTGLITIGTDGRVQLWNISDQMTPEELITAICRKAQRNLTPKQWARYVPGLPYRQVCTSPQR